MNFWWVNHKQTRNQEVSGKYLWSPKKNKNGANNQTYNNMALAIPGDLVFSYADTKIGAIGVVTAKAVEQTKPTEFGSAGANWSADGWLVEVNFLELKPQLKPKTHIDLIAPLLPKVNAPIRKNGLGNQGCYLTAISNELGELLIQLCGNPQLPESSEASVLDENALELLQNDPSIPATQKSQLIKARIGQGLFRQRVISLMPNCLVTGVNEIRLLRASHIKPWHASDNVERLDGHNGLLLAPHVDMLFDKGFISFEDSGQMISSKKLNAEILSRWGIQLKTVHLQFSEATKFYLAFHRENVFLS